MECGKEYRGTLNVSGLSSVTVTTAGTCGKAIINGAQVVANWQAAGANLWSAPLGFVPKQVVMEGKLLELAHTPRVNGNPYLTVKSQSGGTLTLGGLAINGDVIGATIRARDTQWSMVEGTVTGGSASTITTTGLPGGLTGWGAYLEGKRWMLDEPGEWLYENGILYIYSATQPQAVEATASLAINARNAKSLTLDNIVVKNGVTNIDASSSAGLVLKNVEVTNATDFGIDAKCATNLSMTSSSISNTGRDGLSIGYCGDTLRVDKSTFTNIGTVLMPRMTDAAIFGGYTTKMTVTGSTFTNIGYVAIWFFSGSLIDGNTINGTCVTLNDCSAIYTFDRHHVGLNSIVSNNRISNVRGTLNGQLAGSGEASYGIYLDDSSNGVTVRNNTISGAVSGGILLHGAFNNIIENNTFSNNTNAQVYLSDYGFPGTVRNNIIRNNNYGAGTTYKYGVESGDNTALWATYTGNICSAGAVGCK